ncbi:MAG TPA: site-specific DNA-methyltransferase [Gallicola sp.]|nr:site-specific DNA-methyltransferase [Gallicola sp.]
MKLGKYEINKIYNEDSYKAIKNIPDKSIDCIYTDVPYLYQKGGASSTLLGQRMVKMRETLSDISDGFDYIIMDDFIRVMKKINIFIWCSKAQILDIMNYFSKFNVNYEILVWCKENPVPKNNSWLSDIEYCLFFREKCFPLNEGYYLKSKYYVSPLNKSDKDLFNHPTIKPLELVKRHLLHATKPNDIVADFFLGSGTTCVGAMETGRNYIGFEIDKSYFQIAQDRLNGLTQQDRKIKDNGQIDIFDFIK